MELAGKGWDDRMTAAATRGRGIGNFLKEGTEPLLKNADAPGRAA